MELLSSEDLAYYTKLSSQNIESLMSGMAVLLGENEEKIKEIENQNWFNRMTKTIFGKNKATIREIRKNKEKIDIYIAKVILELNKRGLINQEILLVCSEKINKLFEKINNLSEKHLELQDTLKILVESLDKKIQSVDNFTVIISKKNIYQNMNVIEAISDILSKLDERIIFDDEKIEIIIDNMSSWLNESLVFFEDLLNNLLRLDTRKLNIINLKLNDFRNSMLIDLILEAIERKIYFQEKEDEIVKELFFENRIKEEIFLKNKDIFLKLLNCKKIFIRELIDKEKIIKDNSVRYLENEEIKYLKFKAEKGYDEEQYKLGKYYLDMNIFSESLYWFNRAKEQGNVDSIFELSLIYKEGLGVPKDSVKSYSLLKESVLLGNKEAKKFYNI